MGIQTLRLDEHLVAGLVGEAVDLVLDGRAVARPDPFDHPGEHRRAIEIVEDDLVGALVGMGDMAADLTRMHVPRSQVGHHRSRTVARLLLEAREIDALGIDARRGAGLQAIDPKRQGAQTLGQGIGGRIPGTTTTAVVQPDVDHPAEEGAGAQHHGFGQESQSSLGDHAAHGVLVDDQVAGGLLEQRQVRLVFQHATNRGLVAHTIGLGTGCPYRGALAGVEHAKLDPAQVRRQSHGAAEGVDFLDQMTLADPADGGIAGHLAQGLDVVGQQQGLATHAGRGQGSFRSSMATADDDDVKAVGILQGSPRSAQRASGLDIGFVRKIAGQYKPSCG